MSSRGGARLALLWSLLLFAAPLGPLTAQAAFDDPLARRITVRFERTELSAALARLRTIFGVPLAYSPDAVPEGRPVTLTADDETVGVVLNRLLDGTGLRLVSLSGGTIVIAPGVAECRVPSAECQSGPSPVPALATGIRELDQIVVMGTPVSGAPEREQPYAMSVIRGDQLRGQHFSRTAELFRTGLPGVVLWDRGPSGPPAEIAAVRGASSFTARGLKTYIDGVEVASPTLVTLLDPRSLERIEVIRGPQGAALYGSDAINGVIQIITRKGDLGDSPKVKGSASLAAGPFDREALASTMLRQDYAGMMDWGGPWSSFAVDGSVARVGSTQSVPSTRSWSAHGGGRLAFGSLLISGSARGGQFDFVEDQFPTLASPVATVAGRAKVRVATAGLTAVHQLTDWWIQTLVTGYDRAQGALGSYWGGPGSLREPLAATHERGSRTSIRYSSAFAMEAGPTASITATLGLEYTRLSRSRGTYDANLSPTYVTLYDDIERNTGAFFQTKLRAGPVLINAGTRAEWSTSFGADYGTAWAPSLGASWTKPIGNVAVRLRGGWGRGIRPPEPGMSRGMATSVIRQEPNPVLAPETQAGIELGADLYVGGSGYLRATWFNQRATDLIQAVIFQSVRGAQRTYQFQNVGGIKNDGVELEGGFRAGKFGADALLYLTDSRVERIARTYSGHLRVGDRLPEIPEASGSARLSYATRGLEFALGASYVGSWTGYNWTAIEAAEAQQTDPQPVRNYLIRYPGIIKPYFSLSVDVARQFTTFLTIDNLTNTTRFERHNGNPPAGRSVLFGLEVKP